MDNLILLTLISFMMGLVNSTSGGGGVFGVPTLLALGVPPVNVLVLNRISDLGNIAGSLKNYMGIAGFNRNLGLIAIPPILLGAFAGANLIVKADEEVLNAIILVAVMLAVFILLYPAKPFQKKIKPHIGLGVFALLALGVWEGALAMAGGTFGVLLFVFLFRQSYLQAKGVMTFAAIPETLMSATILYLHSDVASEQIVVMFSAAVVGAFIGSKFAIGKGSHFIRYAMATMALAMVAKIVIFDLN